MLNFALNGPVMVGMPWLADQRFSAGPAGLGLLAAAWAAGALVGVILAGSITSQRQGRIVLAAVVVCAVAGDAASACCPGSPVVSAGARDAQGVAIGYCEHRRDLVDPGAGSTTR